MCRPRKGRWLPGVLAVMFVLVSVAGCTSSAGHAASALPAGEIATSTGDASIAGGFTPAVTSTDSPLPAVLPSTDSTGALIRNAAGAILPNPNRTPGATNPAVTQANIQSMICVSGWTSTIRPDSSYTTSLKVGQLASGYAYQGDMSVGDYEEDHLISLELGGAPSDPANLWPEPYNVTNGARTKDIVENTLHDLVCAGRITLVAAQHAIVANWWTAYTDYVGSSAPVTNTNPTITPSDPATPDNPSGATALCNDGTYSYAANHQGACSRHGGVKTFFK